MIALKIEILSFIIGAVLGFLVSTFVLMMVFLDDRWSVGFSDGWKRGCEYGKEYENPTNNTEANNEKLDL